MNFSYLNYDFAEIIHKINHCLISFHDEILKSIKVVYSHPQALGQCSKFLEYSLFIILREQ